MGEVTQIFPDDLSPDTLIVKSPHKCKKRKILSPSNDEKQTKIRQEKS
jgi:hypothetical protein